LDGAVGAERDLPADQLLDPVVAPAQAVEVVGAGHAGGPGADVVEVGEADVQRAAGEPTSPVPGFDQSRQGLPGHVRGGGVLVVGVDQCASLRVDCGQSHLAVAGGFREGFGDPGGVDVGGLGVAGSGDLDVGVAVAGQCRQRGRHHLSDRSLTGA